MTEVIYAAALRMLTQHIRAELEERGFCVVFEDDLKRCWPLEKIARSERAREIEGFGESQGWTAAILEGSFGSRAIFRRLENHLFYSL